MLEKIKKSSLMTKLLYIFSFLLFVGWVMPKINSYYSNVNSYNKSIKELEKTSSKHGLSAKTQNFSENSFKKNTEALFSKVEVQSLGDKTYEVHIEMKKEDLKSFHTFIETISLRYYVEIKDALDFTTEDEIVKVKMTVKAF